MEDQRPQKRSPLATNALAHAAAWLCLVHLLAPAFGLVLGESSRAGHAAFVAAGAGCHLPTLGRAAPRAKMARSSLQHASTSRPPMLVRGPRAGGTRGIESAAAGVQLEETAAILASTAFSMSSSSSASGSSPAGTFSVAASESFFSLPLGFFVCSSCKVSTSETQ